jgi:hypothetical protein
MARPKRSARRGERAARRAGERAADRACRSCFGMHPETLRKKVRQAEADTLREPSDPNDRPIAGWICALLSSAASPAPRCLFSSGSSSRLDRCPLLSTHARRERTTQCHAASGLGADRARSMVGVQCCRRSRHDFAPVSDRQRQERTRPERPRWPGPVHAPKRTRTSTRFPDQALNLITRVSYPSGSRQIV